MVDEPWWDLSAPLMRRDDLNSAESRLNRKGDSWNAVAASWMGGEVAPR